MKTVLVYVIVALGVITEFVQTKELVDLVIDTSGGGIPVANDKHFDFYVKDYFGLITGYSFKTEQIKSYLERDYKKWGDQSEVLKSVYTKAIDQLTEYENDVQMKYQEISPAGIADIVKAINHMRNSEKSFYSKIKLTSQKCHEFVYKNSYFKWEKPALYCVNKKITKTLALQLQYTYDINVYYARLVDKLNMFAEHPAEEHEKDIKTALKKANDDLLVKRSSQIKAIQNLLVEVKACAGSSYEVFEKLEKSFKQQASECF